MLQVTTGERKLLTHGCENWAHKEAVLRPVSLIARPGTQMAAFEGRELGEEWLLQPLPPKSNLNTKARKLFPCFYPLLIFLQN